VGNTSGGGGDQGLPDFSWLNTPKGGKYTKLTQNIPNEHKIFQITIN
jgi:hypothetical protein